MTALTLDLSDLAPPTERPSQAPTTPRAPMRPPADTVPPPEGYVEWAVQWSTDDGVGRS